MDKPYNFDPLQPNILQESLTPYFSRGIQVLDVEKIVRLASDGLGRGILQELIDTTGLSQQFLAVDVFQITPKTFGKYKSSQDIALPARMSEIAVKLIYLFSVGVEVFGSRDHFSQWLRLPAYGLAHRLPSALLKTATGIDMIEDELRRIEFGATA